MRLVVTLQFILISVGIAFQIPQHVRTGNNKVQDGWLLLTVQLIKQIDHDGGEKKT